MNRRQFAIFAAALGGLQSIRLLAAERAPDFEVPDTRMQNRRLSEFKGKTVVLEWTAASCPFVRAQYESGVMPELQRWAAQQGVVWLSVVSTHPSRRDYLPPDKAEALHRKLGCPVIEISELSIEETAARIIAMVERRQTAATTA